MTPALLERLTDVYRKELTLYGEVLGLVERERENLVSCRPISELIGSFERKRSLLSAIESMDHAIEDEKHEYRRERSLLDAHNTGELAGVIEAIRQVIQRIITLEQANEETILAHGDWDPGAGVPGQVTEDSR